MDNIQKQIIEFTHADSLNSAMEIMFKDYIKYKLYYHKNEDNRFKMKWEMSFSEFENKSA